MEKKKNVVPIILCVIIIVALACYLVVVMQREAGLKEKNSQLEQSIQQAQSQLNTIQQEKEDLQNKVDAISNTIAGNTTVDEDLVKEAKADMADYYISTGKWKEFTFSTPVGDEGVFSIYAEKAVQATGFTGASAHIYYLREGILYYHNEDDADLELATGITDLKNQGEDIIAVKGKNAKIYLENPYVIYK